MDENAIDIMDFLEYDTPGSILYASSDSEFLESVIRDYLSYELLDDKNKNEIINYLKSCKRKEIINNPNDKVVKSYLVVTKNLEKEDKPPKPIKPETPKPAPPIKIPDEPKLPEKPKQPNPTDDPALDNSMKPNPDGDSVWHQEVKR